MPTRMLRDWRHSYKIDTLSFEAEVFFTRLIMAADDYGCYYGDVLPLKSGLFPVRESVTIEMMSRCVDECFNAGLIRIYIADGKKFLEIVDFKQRLDKSRRKYPVPKLYTNTAGQLISTDFPEVVNDNKKKNHTTENQNVRAVVNDLPADADTDADTEADTDIVTNTTKQSLSPAKKPEEISYPIEENLNKALRDDRWVRANQTNKQELEQFNKALEEMGEYSKNPLEYKKHFSSWKKRGYLNPSSRKNNGEDWRSESHSAPLTWIDQSKSKTKT